MGRREVDVRIRQQRIIYLNAKEFSQCKRILLLSRREAADDSWYARPKTNLPSTGSFNVFGKTFSDDFGTSKNLEEEAVPEPSKLI